VVPRADREIEACQNATVVEVVKADGASTGGARAARTWEENTKAISKDVLGNAQL
jgi:hypothetical protein